MRTKTLWAAAAVAALCTACGQTGKGGTGGGSGGGSGGGAGGAGGSSDALTAPERDAFDTGGDSNNASQAALVVADSMFQFDPTLDVTKTDVENATAVQAQTTTELNGCGSATLANTTVTVSFGAAPGCTLKSGTVVSGSASLGVSKSGSTLTVAATFTNLVVNGTDLTGNISFVTMNATSFTVTGSLTSKGKTTMVNLTVVGGASQTMTIDGTTTAMQVGVNTSLTFTALTYHRGDCYPNGGTLKLMKGDVSETLTFSASTPMTGTVAVKLGRGTFNTQLPAYGTCPPGRDGG